MLYIRVTIFIFFFCPQSNSETARTRGGRSRFHKSCSGGVGQHLGHRCPPARPSLCSTGCEGSRSLRPRCKNTHTHTHMVKHEQTAPLLFIGRWVHLIRNLCFLRERKAVAGTYGKKGMKNCFSSSHSIFPLMMSLMSITGGTRKQNGLFHTCVECVCVCVCVMCLH